MASDRLTTRIGGLTLPNPIIRGSGEPVMTEAGIRAALAAGAGGVIAKAVNERPEAAKQLDLADYVTLDIDGARSLFNRSGLTFRDTRDWFHAIAAIDRQAAKTNRFVAASIVFAGADGAVAIACMARDAGLRVFELNVGAPHASEASPGAITQETDPARMALAGASAVEVMSIVMHEGFGALTRLIVELDAFLTVRDPRFNDLIGLRADRLASYGAQTPHPDRWRDFVPPETLE